MSYVNVEKAGVLLEIAQLALTREYPEGLAQRYIDLGAADPDGPGGLLLMVAFLAIDHIDVYGHPLGFFKALAADVRSILEANSDRDAGIPVSPWSYARGMCRRLESDLRGEQ